MKKLLCLCLVLLSVCLCSCEALLIGGGLAVLGELMEDEADNGGEQAENAKDQASDSSSSSIYGMNQTVVVKDLEYTVTDAYNTKVIDSFFDGGQTENNFVVITLKIKNNSSSEKYISSSNFYYYRGNNKYEPHNAGLYLDGGFWLNETVGAGLAKTIKIVYEIPSEYQSTDFLQVKDSLKKENIYMK